MLAIHHGTGCWTFNDIPCAIYLEFDITDFVVDNVKASIILPYLNSHLLVAILSVYGMEAAVTLHMHSFNVEATLHSAYIVDGNTL